jgi:hypothetical protein
MVSRSLAFMSVTWPIIMSVFLNVLLRSLSEKEDFAWTWPSVLVFNGHYCNLQGL